jgi:hypothetical protein
VLTTTRVRGLAEIVGNAIAERLDDAVYEAVSAYEQHTRGRLISRLEQLPEDDEGGAS